MSSLPPTGTRGSGRPRQNQSWDASFQHFFDGLANRPGLVIAGVVVILVATAGIVGYINHSESRSQAANGALFQAEKTQEQEMKTWAASEAPPSPTPAAPGKTAPPAAANQVEFQKGDVDARFPETLKKLQGVIAQYPGTRAAFEARMAVGSLYYNHGEPEKAIPWYQKATTSAPRGYDRALAFSSLGYAEENAGKPQDALQSYQKAMSLSEPGIDRGDLLLSVARCYELLKENSKARSTYDQITSQMPNTEQAKMAELLRSRLAPQS